jgi:hypothetical protein
MMVEKRGVLVPVYSPSQQNRRCPSQMESEDTQKAVEA